MQAKTLDMTQGRPLFLMLRFAIPMMIGSIFQSLYSMVDSIVIGRYVGADALAAIGATTSTVNFILLFSTGVTSAISIVISQFFGARDEQGIRDGIAASGHMTLILGVVLGLAGLFGAGPIMRLLGTPENIIDRSIIYIQIICGLTAAQFAYNAAASVLRALGDSKTPLYFLILCSVLNVVLDLVAVLALDMAVAGVALATVCSQAVSAVSCIIYMFKKYPALAPKKDAIKPNWKILLRIMYLGGQMALQGALLSVGMMVITSVINSFGSDIVAAFTVGSNLQNLAAMLFSNFAFGFSVYVGQNFGARRPERIRHGVREIALLVGGITVVATALSLIFARALVRLYVKPEEIAVTEAALEFVRIQSWFFPFLGLIWLYNSTLKGMGKIAVTTVSSFIELGSKILLSLILPMWMGYTGIWFSAPIGWILGLIPTTMYYYMGNGINRWRHSRVLRINKIPLGQICAVRSVQPFKSCTLRTA